MNVQTINALTTVTPGISELNTRIMFWSKFAAQFDETSEAYGMIMANIQTMEPPV